MFPLFFRRTVIGACDTEGPEQGPEGALPDDKYDLILLSHHTGDAATVARNRERRVPRQNQGSMFTRRRLLKGSAQAAAVADAAQRRSEEHTSELQSLMRISYAVFCLKKKKKT